jgi:hypothetical protein
MSSNKKSVLDSCVVSRQAPKASQLTGKDAHPRNYTTTLYDENGKLIDDGNLRELERSYWEWFVDPKQAAELKRRLALVESPNYIPGSEQFLPMEEPDVETDEE